MHDHQADLIVTLTQRGLDPAERARLEAAVAGCPQCLQELDVQRRLAAALQGAKPPGLTELERVRLRREVARQAGIPLGSLSSPPAGRRRRRRLPSPPWQAAAVVAAALVGVVLLGPLLAQLLDAGAPQPGQAPTAEQAPVTAAPEASPDTATAAQAPLVPQRLGDLGPVDAESVRELLDHPSFGAASRVTREEAPAMAPSAPHGNNGEVPCSAEAQQLSPGGLLALTATASFDDREAVLYGFASASGGGPAAPLDQRVLWVLDRQTCQVLNAQSSS